MKPSEMLARVSLADCGQCWCGSEGQCDGAAGPLVPVGTGMVHEARIDRARVKGLLEEE